MKSKEEQEHKEEPSQKGGGGRDHYKSNAVAIFLRIYLLELGLP
jgi:hypothetical protein